MQCGDREGQEEDQTDNGYGNMEQQVKIEGKGGQAIKDKDEEGNEGCCNVAGRRCSRSDGKGTHCGQKGTTIAKGRHMFPSLNTKPFGLYIQRNGHSL